MNKSLEIPTNSSIRLTSVQIHSIKSCIQEVFGKEVKIYLFGSRTNPLLKGGDIDLFVCLENNSSTKLENILKAKSKIELKIGEQKIDLFAATKDDLLTDLFLKEAYSKGVLL